MLPFVIPTSFSKLFISHLFTFYYTLGRTIQDFLREGASQVDITDVQSQKTAEKLPNVHASANWVSWQDTSGLLTA